MAHLPVPVAWLGVVGRRRKLARKRRQNVEVAGVEEDGEQRSLQRLQAGEMASPERGGGLGGVAQAWEGLELPRQPEGIAGELVGVVRRRRNQPRKRRQNTVVVRDEEDCEQRQLQGLQRGGTASPERGGGPGRVALAWEGLELPRRPEGIAGELELGDGGPRPARSGYGFLLIVGCV